MEVVETNAKILYDIKLHENHSKVAKVTDSLNV